MVIKGNGGCIQSRFKFLSKKSFCDHTILANLAIWRATNRQIGDFGGPYLTTYCEIAILVVFGSKNRQIEEFAA